ncbi:MAG: hypothetical protein QOK38_3070 [Acidobacteriaceae bacterium]|nr:hypothetical protein [Acidobacteriaceae bacterium]
MGRKQRREVAQRLDTSRRTGPLSAASIGSSSLDARECLCLDSNFFDSARRTEDHALAEVRA